MASNSAAAELQVLVDHPRVTAIAARWRQAFVGRRHALHQNLPRQHHVLGVGFNGAVTLSEAR